MLIQSINASNDIECTEGKLVSIMYPFPCLQLALGAQGEVRLAELPADAGGPLPLVPLRRPLAQPRREGHADAVRRHGLRRPGRLRMPLPHDVGHTAQDEGTGIDKSFMDTRIPRGDSWVMLAILLAANIKINHL